MALQRKNSDVVMALTAAELRDSRPAKKNGNVFYDASDRLRSTGIDVLTDAQRRLLKRHGLQGKWAVNKNKVAALSKAPVGSDAYRAARLAQAVASGKYGSQRFGEAATPSDWRRVLTGTRANYNRELARARQRRNFKRVDELQAAFKARRREQRQAVSREQAAKREQRRLVAKEAAQKARKEMIKQSRLSGPQSFALSNDLHLPAHVRTRFNRNIELIRTGQNRNGAARRGVMKALVKNMYEAARAAVAVIKRRDIDGRELPGPGYTVVAFIRDVLRKQGLSVVTVMVAKKQKKQELVANKASEAMKKAFVMITSGVSGVLLSKCGLLPGGPLVAAILGPTLKLVEMGAAAKVKADAYAAVEAKYYEWVDKIAEKVFQTKATDKATRQLGRVLKSLTFLGQASKVFGDPRLACLRVPFLGSAIRATINSVVRMLIGYELDWIKLGEVLLRHRGIVAEFLMNDANEHLDLLPLLQDMVEAVPDEVLNQAFNNLNKSAGKVFTENLAKAV